MCNEIDSSGVFATGIDEIAKQEIDRIIEVCANIPEVLSIERTSIRTARYHFNGVFHHMLIADLIIEAQNARWPDIYNARAAIT